MLTVKRDPFLSICSEDLLESFRSVAMERYQEIQQHQKELGETRGSISSRMTEDTAGSSNLKKAPGAPDVFVNREDKAARSASQTSSDRAGTLSLQNTAQSLSTELGSTLASRVQNLRGSELENQHGSTSGAAGSKDEHNPQANGAKSDSLVQARDIPNVPASKDDKDRSLSPDNKSTGRSPNNSRSCSPDNKTRSPDNRSLSPENRRDKPEPGNHNKPDQMFHYKPLNHVSAPSEQKLRKAFEMMDVHCPELHVRLLGIESQVEALYDLLHPWTGKGEGPGPDR
jgi:hypothetical protein